MGDNMNRRGFLKSFLASVAAITVTPKLLALIDAVEHPQWFGVETVGSEWRVIASVDGPDRFFEFQTDTVDAKGKHCVELKLQIVGKKLPHYVVALQPNSSLRWYPGLDQDLYLKSGERLELSARCLGGSCMVAGILLTEKSTRYKPASQDLYDSDLAIF